MLMCDLYDLTNEQNKQLTVVKVVLYSNKYDETYEVLDFTTNIIKLMKY